MRDKTLDHTLKRVYAYGLLLLLAAQIWFADWMFMKYARAFNYKIPSESITVWIGALVVEVIGLVIVVTRYLFPGIKADAEKSA